MDYGKWIFEQYADGMSVEAIAEAALAGPIAYVQGEKVLSHLLPKIGALLNVPEGSIQVVGSARFGFSLRDGSPFGPSYSDLDLAILDEGLYRRCFTNSPNSVGYARFQERDLPTNERVAIRKEFDVLSLSVSDIFAYISVAVYPNQAALVNTQAARIRAFLSVRSLDSKPLAQSGTPNSPTEIDFQRVVDLGTPKYLAPISETTPQNSSPWIVDLECFQRTFGGNPLRKARLAAFSMALSDLSKIVEIQCCLVGGSFLNIANPAPNDLDVVMFYRALQGARPEPGRALQRLTRKFHVSNIDMRCVPCDVEPWLLIKLTSYFTMLYQSSRQEGAPPLGQVLLVQRSHRDGNF